MVKEGEANAVEHLASDTNSTGVEKKANAEAWLLKNKFPHVAQLTTDDFISIMKNPKQPVSFLLPSVQRIIRSREASRR